MTLHQTILPITSRKYAFAFKEHLDDRRITRRVGDERVLRQG